MQLIVAPAFQATSPVSITEGALEEQRKLHGACGLIIRVSNPAMQKRAVDVAVDVKRFLARVEEARASISKPFWTAFKDVNAKAAELTAELTKDLAKIEGLLKTFEIAERKRQQEEAAAAAKAAAEAAAKAAAEAAAILQASAAAAKAAPTPVEAQQLIDLGSVQAKQVQAAAAAPVEVMPYARPKGLSARPRWTFKVDDLLKLANHNVSLVRMEPNISGIQELINQGAREIPGLTIYEDLKTNINAR